MLDKEIFLQILKAIHQKELDEEQAVRIAEILDMVYFGEDDEFEEEDELEPVSKEKKEN